MVALTQDRDTKQRIGDMRSGPMAAATTIFAGALVMRNAAGFLIEAATATGMVGVGRAEHYTDNTGAAGDVELRYRPGCFRYDNSAGGDLIALADIGALCFAVDDQTVARTNGSNTRSPAGIIEDVDTMGVWVRLDEALTNAAS